MTKQILSTNAASQAILSMAMISPVRCRQVADLVRGQSLESAHRRLLLEKVKAARIVMSVLKSAMANAQQKGVADMDRLFVSEIQVNEGPRIKRFMPRAQGRADGRWTRTSHISLKLAEKVAAKKTTKTAAKKKSAKTAKSQQESK